MEKITQLTSKTIVLAIDDVDTDLASRVWLGAVNEVVVHWLFAGGQSPSKAAPELRKMLVGSVRPSPTIGVSVETTVSGGIL